MNRRQFLFAAVAAVAAFVLAKSPRLNDVTDARFTCLPPSPGYPYHIWGYHMDTSQGEIGRVVSASADYVQKNGGVEAVWPKAYRVLKFDMDMRLHKIRYGKNHTDCLKEQMDRLADPNAKVETLDHAS